MVRISISAKQRRFNSTTQRAPFGKQDGMFLFPPYTFPLSPLILLLSSSLSLPFCYMLNLIKPNQDEEITKVTNWTKTKPKFMPEHHLRKEEVQKYFRGFSLSMGAKYVAVKRPELAVFFTIFVIYFLSLIFTLPFCFRLRFPHL